MQGFRFIEQIHTISDVSAGAHSIITLPGGRRYHNIMIQYLESGSAATKANIIGGVGDITVSINSVVQRTMSVTQAIEIPEYYDQGTDNGRIPIYFNQPWVERNDHVMADSLAWPIQSNEKILVDVEILSAATSPTLAVWAEYDVPDPFPRMGNIVTWERVPTAIGATGDKEVSDYERDRPILAIHGFSSDITAAKVTADSRIVFDSQTIAVNNYFNDEMQRDQVSGVYTIDFDRRSNIRGFLPMKRANGAPISSLAVTWTMGGTTDISSIIERYGPRKA